MYLNHLIMFCCRRRTTDSVDRDINNNNEDVTQTLDVCDCQHAVSIGRMFASTVHLLVRRQLCTTR